MKNRLVAIILSVIVIFFVYRYCYFVGSAVVGSLSSCFLYPVVRIQYSVVEPIKNWFFRRVHLIELESLYEALKKDYQCLLDENIALKSVSYYQQEISELLSFKKRYERTGERIVQILARHFSSNNQFYLVNAGSRHGIEKDMVALYGNCLVGRVAEVYPWYCKVYLITDAECKVAAVCSKTGVSGIHEGVNNSQQTVLSYVSHLYNAQENDVVVSSGEGLVFPQGFGLGTIAAVHRGDLVYTIYLKPLLDFSTLRYCTLVAKSDIEIGVGK